LEDMGDLWRLWSLFRQDLYLVNLIPSLGNLGEKTFTTFT
jgi:hypothetical protein